MEKYIDAIKVRALELARSGSHIEGHKLVKSIQKAVCEDEEGFVAAALKTEKGKLLNKENFYNQKLISKTDAKKLVDERIVNEFYKTPPSQTTLVKLDSSRSAVFTGSAKGIFKPITVS